MTNQNPDTRATTAYFKAAHRDDLQRKIDDLFNDVADEGDVLTIFNALKSRFQLIGNVFTTTDIRDTLFARVQGHDVEPVADALIPVLAEHISAQSGIRRVVSEMMSDAGSNALDEEVDTYIMALADDERTPQVALTVDADADQVRLDEFDGSAEMVDFGKSVVGSTVAEARADAENAELSWTPVDGVADDAVITAAHVVFVNNYYGGEDEMVRLA